MNRKRMVRKGTKRARRGVTLVELIVASTILMMGLLSIVGISASVARSLGEARNESLAAMAAQSRFEQLAGSDCDDFTLDYEVTVTHRGITEKYKITAEKNATRLITDNVSWITNKVTRQASFQTIIPCRPGG